MGRGLPQVAARPHLCSPRVGKSGWSFTQRKAVPRCCPFLLHQGGSRWGTGLRCGAGGGNGSSARSGGNSAGLRGVDGARASTRASLRRPSQAVLEAQHARQQQRGWGGEQKAGRSAVHRAGDGAGLAHVKNTSWRVRWMPAPTTSPGLRAKQGGRRRGPKDGRGPARAGEPGLEHDRSRCATMVPIRARTHPHLPPPTRPLSSTVKHSRAQDIRRPGRSLQPPALACSRAGWRARLARRQALQAASPKAGPVFLATRRQAAVVLAPRVPSVPIAVRLKTAATPNTSNGGGGEAAVLTSCA